MKKFESYKGRKDRLLSEMADLKAQFGVSDIYALETGSKSHELAVLEFESLVNNIREGGHELDCQKALNYYLNFQSYRHDSWLEFLDANKVDSRMTFGDKRVLDFLIENGYLNQAHTDFLLQEKYTKDEIAELKSQKAAYCEEHGLMDFHLMNKTPDILMIANGAIYIGDVTVTKDEGNVKIWKHEKYKPIADWFSKQEDIVIHKDFIVREDLSNVGVYIKTFSEVGIIHANQTSRNVYEHFHYSITESMKLAYDFCSDKGALHTLININNQKTIPLEQLKLNYPHTPYEDYVPNLTEHEVIGMIKRRVEKLDPKTFFDTGAKSTSDAFDRVVESNKEAKNYCKPKSTLKVIDNSEYYEKLSGNDLLLDYTTDVQYCPADNEVSKLLLHVLPTPRQVDLMKEIYKDKTPSRDVKKSEKYKKCKVYGNGYYDCLDQGEGNLIRDLKSKLQRGKKDPNEKKAPEQVNPMYYDSCCHFITQSMKHYGSMSNKTPFLTDAWDSRSGLEHQESKEVRDVYEYVRKTNGAQLCHSMAQLYNKIVHTSTYQGQKTIVYIPPNGSFVAIIPKNHAPINRSSCDIPFIFITRSWKDVQLTHIEYEHTVCSEKYRYYVSKLCRLNVNKIAGWNNAGYQLVSSATYMLSISKQLQLSKEKYIGLLTYMILDCHQKTSEYLDLLKYVSFMPFSEIHLLPKLVEDKFNLLMKTQLDAWMFNHMREFVKELAELEKLQASKPLVHIINNRLVTDCLGLDIKLPTFCEPTIRHDNCVSYIEEISMVFTVRPKHLYGSQFMDKAMSSICKWNDDYEKSVEKYGDWVIGGEGEGDFPFECDFSYCASAIYYAAKAAADLNPMNTNQVHSDVLRCDMFEFMHYNCTLRGCTKAKHDRKTNVDLHSTSIDECLKYYDSKNFVDKDCTVISCAQETLRDKTHIMQFTKSEKEQRGGGRPIATPTLRDKMMLMCVEKPELAKGKRTTNNIIVPKKNKLKEQADNYKEAIVHGSVMKFKYCAQITEDQTKFSEMDNTRKFKIYLRSDKNAPREVRQIQLDVLDRLENREHLVKRLPGEILDKHEKWINEERNGVKAIIGWPQGMLNFISTSVHSDADLWITRAYNIAYPLEQVYTRGLVHSDDSSVIVCFNDMEHYKKFCIFRMEAKRMFCLKLNIKKLWGSVFFGEIVSNYNVNGNVHMSVAKPIANSFNNLTFHNWPTDVSNQISTIQQCYRNGATIPILIMMNTVLKQQLVSTYQVKGMQLNLLDVLPVDLGGYPSNSAFELGVTGVTCHYKKLIEKYGNKKHVVPASIVRYCLAKSKEMMMEGPAKAKQMIISNDWADLCEEDTSLRRLTSDDFENVVMPSKGDIFMCIKHLMPKSTKVKKTIERIKSLPFESSGLELIIPRPKTLSEAMGNLKAQTSNMFYQLASEHYTQSSKRMAMSQSMQSSGRVISLHGYPPMSYNQLLELLVELSGNLVMDTTLIKTAFSDDNELVDLCSKVVNSSEHYLIHPDNRKVLNRMPTVDDKFKTIAPLKDVLLYIIESNYKSYKSCSKDLGGKELHSILQTLYSSYGSRKADFETVRNDSILIRERFADFFTFYNVIAACSLIMRQFMSSVQSRLWVQPNLRQDSLQTFIESLYGKTVSLQKNFSMSILMRTRHSNSEAKNWVRTLYTTEVLNRIYKGKFDVMGIKTEKQTYQSVAEFLPTLDYKSLDDEYMLKYSMLVLLHSGNDDTIRSVIKRKKYSQKWIRAQKHKNGAYYGKFVVLVRYSGIVLKFSGEPGNMEVISSDDDIVKVLMAMKLFVERNFKYYGYTNAGEWGKSDFWRTEFPAQNNLVYYSSVNTQVKQNVPSGYKSVSFRKNPNIKHDFPDVAEVTGTVELDDGLRIVSIRQGKGSYRVDSVYQDLGLPLSNKITLTPEWLDKISVADLYHTHIILDLTMDRYFNVSKNDLLKCLKGCLEFHNGHVLRFYYNCILNMAKQDQLPEREEFPPVMMETFDLKGMTAETLLEIGRTTKVEELNPEGLEFNSEIEVERQGAILIHKDLVRLLCSMYAGLPSTLDTCDFIRIICKDEYVRESIVRDISACKENDMPLSETFEMMIEASGAAEVDPELYCFIKSTKLDLGSKWEDINIASIIEVNSYNDYNKALIRLKSFKSMLVEHNMDELSEDKNILDVVSSMV